MFYKCFAWDSDVKQSRPLTKCGLQCGYLAKTHVKTAHEFHDLNMDFCCLRTAFDLSDNNVKQLYIYTDRYSCKNNVLFHSFVLGHNFGSECNSSWPLV